ncbi:MAG TPA: DUF6132 family protein [Bacteroidales bacterium]|nr:DUF6132 family protein [Bacteroidales bacterium]
MQCPIYLRKHRLTILGGILGGVGGYLYYHFVGCTSGTCPITSNPIMSSIWGVLVGGLLFNTFEKKPVANKPSDTDEIPE